MSKILQLQHNINRSDKIIFSQVFFIFDLLINIILFIVTASEYKITNISFLHPLLCVMLVNSSGV